VNQYGEGIIIKKIVITNIILFLTVFFAKVLHFIELKKLSQVGPIKGIGTDFFNLGIGISDDVLVIITDFSIYVLSIGLLINLFFLYRLYKTSKTTK
jgi:hypothetical protein